MARKKDPVTLINFVLDKSGSMETIRQATISGFNEFRQDQVKLPGETLFSLTTFDTAFDVRFTAAPVAQVPDLTMQTYEPDGMTALYDAIAYTVHRADEWIAAAKTKPDKVLFVIMTDGEENSSREFDQQKVFALIDAHRDKHQFEFVYLGANQDAYAVGEAIGVRRSHSRPYAASPAEARHAMRVVSAGTRMWHEQAAPQAKEFFVDAAEAEADERDAADPAK